MPVGLVYDPVYLKHDTGVHIEHGGRLKAIISYLEQIRLESKLSPVQPRPATFDELTLIHQPGHIRRIEALASSGGGYIDSDTVVSAGSYEAAIYAAGGTIQAVDAVMNGYVECAFALVRPPGHHATPNRAMGFCLFNSIAIAAAHALFKYNFSRVAIIDFDVHHGNGTQAAFNSNSRVLFVSTHQYPFYPGTGSFTDIGSGGAEGTKVNIPLPAGCGDAEYLLSFEQVVIPVVRRFRPQLIMVSAGYDSHWADNISSMQVSVSGFGKIVNIIKKLAGELCGNRLVLALEGGYNLPALATSVSATFEVLLGYDKIEGEPELSPPNLNRPDIGPLLRRIREIHDL